MLIFVLSISSAFAGTLISGSQVDVKSNYQGVNNLSLVGTWSTTPAVNDKLYITNALLPEDNNGNQYTMRQQVVIDVPSPKYEEIFGVINQQPLFKAEYVVSDWYYALGREACISKMKADIVANNQFLVDYYLESSSAIMCRAGFVKKTTQVGWIGDVSRTGLTYSQTVTIDGVGTMTLSSNERTSSITATIPGVARVATVGFSQWFNAPLDAKNIIAYDGSSATGTRSWKPVYTTLGTTAVQSSKQQILTVLSSTDVAKITSDTTIQQYVAKYNSDVDALVSAKGNALTPWSTVGDVSLIRTSGNNIYVPYKKTAYVSQLQFVIAGEKFGLFIPTGKPQIVSFDGKVTFDETGTGKVKYSVKNVGEAQGTFDVSLSCEGEVSGVGDQILVQPGKTVSGDIVISGKTTANKDLSTTCSLIAKDTTTQEQDKKTISVTVTHKENCIANQEDEPVQDGVNMIVNVRDTSCAIVDVKKCLIATSLFEKKDGTYVCVDKPAGATPSTPDTGDKFSSTLAYWSIGLGVLFAGLAYFNVAPYLTAVPKKYRVWGELIIAGVVFVIVFFAVPMIVNWFRSIFSLVN